MPGVFYVGAPAHAVHLAAPPQVMYRVNGGFDGTEFIIVNCGRKGSAMKFTRVTAALIGILAVAMAMPRALGGAQQVPQGMPAADLLQYAPGDTQGVVVLDTGSMPQQLLSQAEATSGPFKPAQLQQLAAFIGWTPQTMSAMMGGSPGNIPASAVIRHSAPADQVEQFLSGEASSTSTIAGMQAYQGPQQSFAALPADDTMLIASSEDRLSSLIQAYEQGQGQGLPDAVASILRPGDQAAVVAAFAIPQQLAAMAGQNQSIPPALQALNGVSISLSFPGEELALQAVGLFRDSQQASMMAQMLQGQLQNMKESGAGMMLPGGPSGGQGDAQQGQNPMADILDTVQVASSGSEMTVSMRASISMLSQAIAGNIAQRMGGPPAGQSGQEVTFGQQETQPQQDTQPQQNGQPQAADGTTIGTASEEADGVRVQVTLKRGRWFQEDRLLVETRINNQGSGKRLVAYGYSLNDGQGGTVAESGGAAELKAGGSQTFSSPAIDKGKEGQVSGITLTYVDILSSGENTQE